MIEECYSQGNFIPYFQLHFLCVLQSKVKCFIKINKTFVRNFSVYKHSTYTSRPVFPGYMSKAQMETRRHGFLGTLLLRIVLLPLRFQVNCIQQNLEVEAKIQKYEKKKYGNRPDEIRSYIAETLNKPFINSSKKINVQDTVFAGIRLLYFFRSGCT